MGSHQAFVGRNEFNFDNIAKTHNVLSEPQRVHCSTLNMEGVI